MDLIAFTSRKDYLPLVAGLLISAIVYSAHRVWRRRKGAPVRAHTPPADLPEKTRSAKERAPGEWEPTRFDYPHVEASKEHFSALKPIPYRPFKWGDYYVTMGIRSMAWDEWIELDSEFPKFHNVTEYRIRTAGDRLVQVQDAQPGIVDSGHAAAREFMYELAEYLSRRHPDVYSVTRHPVSKNDEENGWYGEGRIKTITILPFEETHDLDAEEPLKVARMLIQEDFTIMLEGSDGRYYLQAGAVVIAGSWRLEDKMGMPLEEIHTSGNVPQYKNKLQMSMDRFFRRLPLDKPVVRNNYAFQVVQEAHARQPAPAPGSLLDVDPDELAWAATMNGNESTSEYVRAKHINDQWDTSEDIAPGMRPGIQKDTEATPATLRLRTERQTLRRLPKTGAIVFTIRVYQTKLEELVCEPGVPGRMASAIRSWPEDVARYKARGAYESILPLLDRCHAEQVANGVVSDEGKKSNMNFPF
ncbi:hypothetical protein OH76DRAFT_61641 [Lentinus brumalis]|uniref:HRQ family protein n=1 Tax=Lentinus brumalis TaxID=2498619 RepID=A0A371DKE2_9APHY|nr:hypothetical protein OH76DRAFT_61641 [Polyporus brumalis]